VTGSIRVVLAEMPRMTAAIIRAALTDAGMKVTDEVTAGEALRRAGRDSGATVVILPNAAPGVGEACAGALRANAGLKILLAVTSERRADLLELRLLGTDVGRRGVVEAIRAVVASPVVPLRDGNE